jgi:starch-binding outer membrane protein, SusD/RagB family
MHRNTSNYRHARRRFSPAPARCLIPMALAVALAGCSLDTLINVKAPSRVLADGLDVPANAALLVGSAAADFECALGHYIVAGGLTGNEFEVATGLITMKEYDKRSFTPVSSDYALVTCDQTTTIGVYRPLSTARWDADHILNLLQGWSDTDVTNRQDKIAEAAAYAGYSLVLLGEGMCSAALDLGPEMTPDQLLSEAESRFTTSIAAANQAGDSVWLNMSLIGRARARLDLGRKADAAADAALVPNGFTQYATYSSDSPRRENPVYTRNNRTGNVSVQAVYQALTFDGVPDSRVNVVDSGQKGIDGVTENWVQMKYPTAESPIPIASWREARLIQAEAAGGQQAVAFINQLHAAAGLPPFSSTDESAIQAQIVQERQRELFLEGQHLGDLKRYGSPLVPAAGAPFKDGGGVYGDQECFPLPNIEINNNPNINH